MSKTIENLEFVGKSPKIERKFGKFYLGIHLALTYPKTSKKKSKTIENLKFCWKIPQNWVKIWEIQSWYTFSPNILQNLKKMPKTIKNFQLCWKIPQNWETIWEISSWYPFSHHRVQNFKNCQKQSKFLKFVKKSPKIKRKFRKFHLDIHLALIYSKILKKVKNNQKSWNLLENPPKLRENLENFILISI